MISRSVLQTLTYSDHFGFPLTLDEIHLRLINSEPYSLERVFGTLQLMIKKSQIAQTGDYYHLSGQKFLVARRLKRARLSRPLFLRASRLAATLGRVPGVLAIYLTGSLALGNTMGDADIDFMVITNNHRLWTTRLLLTLYTELFGLRRRPNSTKNSGKLCLNLYLTPTTYDLPVSKQSLYTAYELLQAVPLYDPSGTRSALLAANSWIHDYLPNFVLPKPGTRTLLKRNSWLHAKKGPAAAGRRVLVGTIESLCYHLQLAYMRRHLTREYVTPNSAFFHPHDPSKAVLQKLQV